MLLLAVGAVTAALSLIIILTRHALHSCLPQAAQLPSLQAELAVLKATAKQAQELEQQLPMWQEQAQRAAELEATIAELAPQAAGLPELKQEVAGLMERVAEAEAVRARMQVRHSGLLCNAGALWSVL
jgi:hypothetical protein